MTAQPSPLFNDGKMNCQTKKFYCPDRALTVGLSPMQFQIYYRLCVLGRKTRTIWASHSELAEMFEVSRKTIIGTIQALIERGMLRKMQHPRHESKSIYILIEDSDWKPRNCESDTHFAADSSAENCVRGTQETVHPVHTSNIHRRKNKKKEYDLCVHASESAPDPAPPEDTHGDTNIDFSQAEKLAHDWLDYERERQPASVSGNIESYSKAIRKLCLRHGHTEDIVRDVWEYSKHDRYWRQAMPSPMALLQRCRDGRYRYEKLCAEVAKPGSWLHSQLLTAAERRHP